ncbi:hypothetical protein J7E97_11860 [Streptomyces sp. ISL-66]|uniref:hypothetical protein n=1 Tax=Streptomyces sp. ISL-66 TaxID=2819186 RepID=UPI001BEC41AD|nr:hypothetical protein [Streptomyces sp. ISL-66]MBT2468554.1 hypothetical protein [Streptomyces sp. ISL-66]
MGGRKHAERIHRGRLRRPPPRRAVLLLAFGMLAGAVFLCARPGTGHAAPGHARAGHARAGHAAPGLAAAEYPAAGHLTLGHPAAEHVAGRTGSAEAAYVFCVSPHELPGCSPFSHVTPGVLPVPPPAVAVAGGEPVPGGRTARPGRQRPPSALARGPDLYALRVLRT